MNAQGVVAVLLLVLAAIAAVKFFGVGDILDGLFAAVFWFVVLGGIIALVVWLLSGA